MVPDINELSAKTARALMSLIKTVEALEADGCIVSTEGSVAAGLLPEILSVSAAEAGHPYCDVGAVSRTVTALTDIRDERYRKMLISRVLETAEQYDKEEGACLKILKEFDGRVLEKDRDFYKKMGGADIGLSDMYTETVKAVITIMQKG